MIASSISMCGGNHSSVTLRVVNLESVSRRGPAHRCASHTLAVTPSSHQPGNCEAADAGEGLREATETHSIDWRSTIGLFIQRAQTRVRKATKILLALLGGCVFAIDRPPTGLSISLALSQSWWILPFSVVLVSLAVLTSSLFLGAFVTERIPARLLSTSYLVCCPLLAVLSLSSSVSIALAPPAWVGLAAPALLLASAWGYYRSLKYSGEEEEEPRTDHLPACGT
jgi:hypothetical protein